MHTCSKLVIRPQNDGICWKFLNQSRAFAIGKFHCSSMPVAQLKDKNEFVNGFDLSLLDDDWIPSRSQSNLVHSLERLLSATEYRLKRCQVLNEGALSRWEFRLNNIFFNYDTGYYRLATDLNTVSRNIHKLSKKAHSAMDKFENMESNVIRQECMKWTVEWPSPFTQSLVSNHWPTLLQSPSYELGACFWHCQLRKIPFHKPNANELYYKLGVFVGPKQVAHFNELIALKAKLKVLLCVRYKELMDEHQTYSPQEIIYNRDEEGNVVEKIQIESSVEDDHNTREHNTEMEKALEVQTRDIDFEIDTDFTKIQDGAVRLMSWGKFVPELQDVIDEKTGLIPHQNVCVDIKVQVIDQCVTYKTDK